MAYPLFTMPDANLCGGLRHLQAQRAEVNRPAIKRLAIAALIASALLIQAYLETTLGFTPNH